MGKRKHSQPPPPPPFVAMTPENKARIDAMDFEEMFRLLRFAPVGEPLFQSETGEYFMKVWKEKCDALPAGAYAATSRLIGWQPS